jgi:hypothetical protein
VTDVISGRSVVADPWEVEFLGVYRGSFAFSASRNDDLVGQERVAIGQIQYRLVSQLLSMIGARSPLEDYLVVRVHNMKVADPTAGNPVDVPLDKLGKFLMVFADPEPPKLCPGVVHRHASLPLDRPWGFGDAMA